MTNFIVNDNVTALTGIVLSMGTSGTTRVGRDGSVIAGTGVAIAGSGTSHQVTVDGEVIGGTGISLGSDVQGVGHKVTIGKAGSVETTGYDSLAIYLAGYGSKIANLGLIRGGIAIDTDFTSGGVRPASVIDNVGEIYGSITLAGGNPLKLKNTGLIDAVLFGSTDAVNTNSSAADGVLNDGEIRGNIVLHGGNDSYDGRLGKLFGTVWGGDGNDALYGGEGADVFNGEAGSDILVGAAGDDVLGGGAGSDQINGGAGADLLSGGLDNDQLDGGTGADSLYGGAGDDTYTVDNKSDVIVEIAGEGVIDQVSALVSYTLGANAGVEGVYYEGKGNGTLVGNTFGQKLVGNSGNDTLDGKGGNDTLDGYIGQDKLTGGTGKDIFLFRELATVPKVDTITDFKVVDDIIHLENAVFKALAAGALAGPAFAKNTTGKPADASDRIIYETDTGKLFYDPDGTGAAKTVQFAILSKSLALTAGDFLVI